MSETLGRQVSCWLHLFCGGNVPSSSSSVYMCDDCDDEEIKMSQNHQKKEERKECMYDMIKTMLC